MLFIIHCFVSKTGSLEKKMFYLVNFFQKIFHIVYLIGANNGEQDSNSVRILMHSILSNIIQ